VTRRSRSIITAVAAGCLAVVVLGTIAEPPPARADVAGRSSAEVVTRLASDFAAPYTRSVVLLVDHLPVAATSDSGRALVRRITTPLARIAGVTAIASPANLLDTLLIGQDNRSALVVIGLAPDAGPRVLEELRQVATASRDAIDTGLHLAWTGEELLAHDVDRAATTAMRRAELVALPVTLAAAAIAFGGLAAALLAVGQATLAVVVSLAVLRLAGYLVPLAPLAGPVTVIVAAALTLDYALWRRRGGLDRRGIAMAAAIATCGFAALLLAPTAGIRSAALGGVVAVVTAALVTTSAGSPVIAVHPDRRSSRFGHGIVARPLLVLLVAAVPLGVLAWRGVQAPLSGNPLATLPDSLPSRLAIDRLAALGRAPAVMPVLVLAELPAGHTVFEADGWRFVSELGRRIEAIDGVARVHSVTTIGTRERVVTRDVVPAGVLASFVSTDHRRALLQVTAPPDDDLADLMVLVDRIEHAVSGHGVVHVGGVAAAVRDLGHTLGAALPRLALLAACGTWLGLALLLRAPVVAAKAVILNLLVASAAVGAVSLLSPLARTHGLPVTVPLVAFGTAFALSMDYELLLLLAVRRAGGVGRAAIVAGVAVAAPLFLRGGALLVILCGAFALSEFAPLALLGQVLVAAIVLDVLVVRPIVAPALLMVLGDWNWWPSGPGR
jgi:RND superfamily putative drug exporter